MLILILIALAAAAVLSISWYCYRICFFSPKKGRRMPFDHVDDPQFRAVEDTIFRVISIMERYPYEDVCIRAKDGVRLRGRYYHVRDGAPLLILCHGYRSAALRDCCGGHALAQKLGFNALVIHQRAHGESGGHTISFGIKESGDVVRWAEYAQNRFGPEIPVILFGLSMGAATVLMGCAEGYPANVKAIIADSAYSSPADIIKKVCRDLGYPTALYPFAKLGAQLFGGFDLESRTALEAVRDTRIPILIIHGEDDHLVPWGMGREIAENCMGRCHIFTVPGADHGLACMADPDGYEQAIRRFLALLPIPGTER